jgi:hypothetical protein
MLPGMRHFAILAFLCGTVLAGSGDPQVGTVRSSRPIKLLLGQPLSEWTAWFGTPRSQNGKNAVYQTESGTAYATFGDSGLAESASFVANLTDLNRLVAIVTDVCRALGVNYKDEADGPQGRFHRYENKDGSMRAAVSALPPQLVIIAQTKAFGMSDKTPMTAAIWK